MNGDHIIIDVPKISPKLAGALRREKRECKGGGKYDTCEKQTAALHGWCAGCVKARRWLREGRFQPKKAKYETATFETLDEVINFYRNLRE